PRSSTGRPLQTAPMPRFRRHLRRLADPSWKESCGRALSCGIKSGFVSRRCRSGGASCVAIEEAMVSPSIPALTGVSVNGRTSTMKRVSRHLGSVAVIAVWAVTATAVRADDVDQKYQPDRYL